MVKSVHIYGLNAHGISAARLARRLGLAVTASDLNTAPEFVVQVRNQLPTVPLSFGEHPEDRLAAAEYVVVSPGVVQDAEMWRQVTETPNWISIADFACAVNRWPNPKLIITGTYGKTTLCSLLQAYLARVGRSALVAGNYSRPISGLQPGSEAEYLIFELDYQQLVASKKLRAEAAVVLNIQPGDDVFGSDELYIRTKLAAAGLVRESGKAFTTPEVMKQALDCGLAQGPWVVPTAAARFDAGLIPSTTASLLNALVADLDLPPIAPEDWLSLAGCLPKGRRNLVAVDPKLDLINDGAAKGAIAVASLVAKLEAMAGETILITSGRDIEARGVQIVRLADGSAQALDTAVQCAVALTGSKKAVIAYSPGVATVGTGIPSILHRIDLFEDLARRYSQQRSTPDTAPWQGK